MPVTAIPSAAAFVVNKTPVRESGAIVIGIILLLASVILEQYRQWLIDPYRDVQR